MTLYRPERKSPEAYACAAQLIMDELGKLPKGYTDEMVVGDIVAALRRPTVFEALEELNFRVWSVTDQISALFQRRDAFMADGYTIAVGNWVETHHISAQRKPGDQQSITMGQYQLKIEIVRVDARMARYQVKVAGQLDAPENFFYVSFEDLHDLAEPAEAFSLRSA